MKIIFILSTILMAAASLVAAQEPAREAALKAKAAVMVECLTTGQYQKATENFDIDMRTMLPPDKLRTAWSGVRSQLGPFVEVKEYRFEKGRNLDVVHAICRLEKDSIDIQMAFDSSQRMSGLYFRPVAAQGEDMKKPKDIAEQEVTVGSGAWALPGTLSLPKGSGPFPAVVLVHGSGPHDRDETVGPNKPFKELAWGLVERGIAVLRYEKRTKAHAKECQAMLADITMKEETVDDALLAADLLRKNSLIAPGSIYVLGHSQGGYLMPRILGADSAIAGGIILAGPSRPLEVLLIEQFEYIDSLAEHKDKELSQLIETTKKQIDVLKSPGLSPSTSAKDLPLGVPAKYWLVLRGYQPAAEAAGLRQRLLVIQAGRDYQVTMADYQGWQKALEGKGNVAFKLYPNCNHLFIEGKGKATPEEYEKPGRMSKKVIEDIAKWVLEK